MSHEQRIGWRIKRQRGSHRILERPGWPNFVFAFHDRDEIGPRIPSFIRTRLGRIAKRTALQPKDLWASLQNEQRIDVHPERLGFGVRDSGFGIRDSGFGIRDSGFSRSHVLTFSRSHVLRFSRSHVLTFSRSHVLTFSRSHVLTLGSKGYYDLILQ